MALVARTAMRTLTLFISTPGFPCGAGVASVLESVSACTRPVHIGQVASSRRAGFQSLSARTRESGGQAGLHSTPRGLELFVPA